MSLFPLSAIASQLNNITVDDGSRSAIQQALVQGLEVTVHQSPITVNGWQGSGYSVLDPKTGVGAYQISGGASGGFASFNDISSFSLTGIWNEFEDSITYLLGLIGKRIGPLISSFFGFKLAYKILKGDCSDIQTAPIKLLAVTLVITSLLVTFIPFFAILTIGAATASVFSAIFGLIAAILQSDIGRNCNG